MFTFNISSAVLLSVALLLSEKKLQVEANECYHNSDCGNNKYCCKQQYSWQGQVCRYGGCVDMSCYWNSDCGGPGECCNYSNYCTRSGCYKGSATRSPRDRCSYNSDCDKNKYCCKERYTSVCSIGGCVGRSCLRDSDCGGLGECCSSFTNFCAESHNCDHHVTKALDSWLIAVIVVSVLVVVVVILIAIVVCSYRGRTSASRGRSQQGILVNQQNGETVVDLQNTQTAQDNPEQLHMPPPPHPDYFNKGYLDLPSSQPVAQVQPDSSLY